MSTPKLFAIVGDKFKILFGLLNTVARWTAECADYYVPMVLTPQNRPNLFQLVNRNTDWSAGIKPKINHKTVNPYSGKNIVQVTTLVRMHVKIR